MTVTDAALNKMKKQLLEKSNELGNNIKELEKKLNERLEWNQVDKRQHNRTYLDESQFEITYRITSINSHPRITHPSNNRPITEPSKK